MRAYALACSVILLSACSRVHDGADTGIPPSDATAAELRRLKEVEWPKAYREQDTVLLDRILHPDFEMVDAEGHVYRKQDEMEWIRTHTWSVDSFRYEIKKKAASKKPGMTKAAATKTGDKGAKAATPDEVAAQHLLVMHVGGQRAPASITRTKEEAKKRADEANAKLKKGASFDEVVKEYTDEPGSATKTPPGDLRTFKKGQMTPLFENAAFGLKVGEVSGVVETPFGYHIIKRYKLASSVVSLLDEKSRRSSGSRRGFRRSGCGCLASHRPSRRAGPLAQLVTRAISGGLYRLRGAARRAWLFSGSMLHCEGSALRFFGSTLHLKASTLHLKGATLRNLVSKLRFF